MLKKSLAITAIFIILIATAIYKYTLRPLGINEINSGSSYNIVVAGAGTGGISAAIQAARMGSKVLLTEETDLLGGQIGAAAVTSTDIGSWKWNSGISAEYIAKVKAYYAQKGLSPGTCYFNPDSVCPEPHVARQILAAMISSEPNITLAYRTKITKVFKDGSQITGVELNNQTNITTKLLIDATEYGDILPLAQADYRYGNSTNTNYVDNSCIQDITYLAVVKKYPNGVPDALKIKTPPPGYNDSIKQKFAAIVTKNGSNTFNGQYPFSVSLHNSYRGMPNSQSTSNEITKTGVNWANDYAIPNARSYLDDLEYRKTTNCSAKLHTIQFIYYLQTELGLTDWAVASDEGYDTAYNQSQACTNIPTELKTIEHNLPVIPYVRESRRMIGRATLTAKDIYRTGSPKRARSLEPTSIAIGDYHTDLHNCNTNQTLESNFEKSSDNSDVGPFQIPINTLISNNVDGLIAAEKNISVSRLVNGATRLQPVTMAVGQAAGALAALSSISQVKPRDINSAAVQSALLNSLSILYPSFDITPSHPLFRAIQLSLLRMQILPISEVNFNPDQKITKTEVAIALMRAKYGPGYVPTSKTAIYTDVPSTLWSAPWINQLHIDGYSLSCEPNKFCPDKTVTRADLAIMLGKAKYGPSIPSVSQSVFMDLAISNPATPWAQKLYENNITSGCSAQPLNFCPATEVTRSQLAVFLASAYPQPVVTNQTLNPSPTPSPVISPSPITTKPGDLNKDGFVNIRDFNLLISGFGTLYTIQDFNKIITNFNK